MGWCAFERVTQEELGLDELAVSFLFPEDELDDEDESLFDDEEDDSDDFDSDDDSLAAPSLPFDFPPDFDERLSVL